MRFLFISIIRASTPARVIWAEVRAQGRNNSKYLRGTKAVRKALIGLFIATRWDCFCGRGQLTVPLSIPQMTHERLWNSGRMIMTDENQRTRRKTCPSVTLYTTSLWYAGGDKPSELRQGLGNGFSTQRGTLWFMQVTHQVTVRTVYECIWN
jgi:hypothetical protein